MKELQRRRKIKRIKLIKTENNQIDLDKLREITIGNMKEIMSRQADISLNDVYDIGIVDDGSLQFKFPKSIKDRQILVMLAYNVWFYDIDKKELKND